ncbi:MAG: carboxypeptidase-like regulatory domain-containing protein, partial [Candidatus Omnitrophica bacterium]|nr:carboxypeptidase-like regulatory domain-containing protein [Candidatus Omnitrophota bacterium]
PDAAHIYCNEEKLLDLTPHVMQSLLPRTYTITFEKKGYFSYRTSVTVRPATVSEINVTLIPNIKNMEKVEFPFTVYRFFKLASSVEEKHIAVTDTGIYELKKAFKVEKCITTHTFSTEAARALCDVLEINNRVVFWSKKNLWTIVLPEGSKTFDSPLTPIYTAEDTIRHVFPGFNDQYLIVQDGKKVLAIDSKNAAAYFPLADIKTRDGEIYFDADSDILYIHEKNIKKNEVTIFKKKLQNNFVKQLQALTHERNKNKKNP